MRITQELVLAYVAGAVTRPELREAIEAARDTDPEVRYWFDLYDPDAVDETAEADGELNNGDSLEG